MLVFFKVGRFYEFYDAQAAIGCLVFGLKPVPGLRGFRLGCGFHFSRLGKYLGLAVEYGFHVALLREYTMEDGRIGRHLVRFIAGCGNT